jgi:hypothetical protein
VIFSARTSPDQGVSCRSIHRALYGFYGTDIRTCIERVKDCEADGFVKVLDPSSRPCTASPGCLIAATDNLYNSFDRHAGDTIEELSAAFAGRDQRRVENLIRWGFFAEQTIKKHKAVALTPVAGEAISKSLADTEPLLRDLHAKLASRPAQVITARSA